MAFAESKALASAVGGIQREACKLQAASVSRQIIYIFFKVARCWSEKPKSRPKIINQLTHWLANSWCAERISTTSHAKAVVHARACLRHRAAGGKHFCGCLLCISALTMHHHRLRHEQRQQHHQSVVSLRCKTLLQVAHL